MRLRIGRALVWVAGRVLRVAADLRGEPLAIVCMHCVELHVEQRYRVAYMRGLAARSQVPGFERRGPTVGEA